MDGALGYTEHRREEENKVTKRHATFWTQFFANAQIFPFSLVERREDGCVVCERSREIGCLDGERYMNCEGGRVGVRRLEGGKRCVDGVVE